MMLRITKLAKMLLHSSLTAMGAWTAQWTFKSWVQCDTFSFIKQGNYLPKRAVLTVKMSHMKNC